MASTQRQYPPAKPARILRCGASLTLVLLASCAASLLPPTGDLRLDLVHADPKVRIDAAFDAAHEKRTDLAAILVENLTDRDGAVRMFNVIALRELSGRDFGYKPHGTEPEREKAVARWREWIRETIPTQTGATKTP